MKQIGLFVFGMLVICLSVYMPIAVLASGGARNLDGKLIIFVMSGFGLLSSGCIFFSWNENRRDYNEKGDKMSVDEEGRLCFKTAKRWRKRLFGENV